MRRSAASTVALLLAAPLSACGGGEAAPVCQSAQDLEDSVRAVRKVDLRAEGGLQDLKSALEKVKTDLDAVRSDGAKEFSQQIDAVKSAYGDLEATIKQRQEGATGLVPQAVAAASALKTAVQNLAQDVAKTC